MEDRTLPSTFVFTNAAGGGGWNTPGNWAVGGAGTLALPGPTDDVAIGAIGGVTFAVVLDGSNATVNSVGLGVGCSLTVNSALEANSIATDPGTVFSVTTGTQPAEVKIDQTATFSGSVIDAGRIIANTTNPFMGTGVTFAGGALIGPGDLNGNLVAGPNSSITFTNTGEFAPGATFGIGSGSIIVAAGVTVDGNLDVNNESLSLVSGGTLGGAGSVTINSNLNWTGGAITVGGGVTAWPGPSPPAAAEPRPSAAS